MPLVINSIGGGHTCNTQDIYTETILKNKSVLAIGWQAPGLINGFLAANFDLKGFNSIKCVSPTLSLTTCSSSALKLNKAVGSNF